VFASGVGRCLGQPQLRGERHFERPRRGTKIKDALLARETVEQVDTSPAGSGEARGVRPPHHAVLSRGKAERWPLANLALQTDDHLPIRQPVYEVGGRRFRGALLPTEIPASREPRPAAQSATAADSGRNASGPDERRIAKSGSYFDDVTRDPRPYGIENTTDKVRRPGAVRRRRDAVCTERIVGLSGQSLPDFLLGWK
jgi:hypothetical protein